MAMDMGTPGERITGDPQHTAATRLPTMGSRELADAIPDAGIGW
jgi:hypothetical protein